MFILKKDSRRFARMFSNIDDGGGGGTWKWKVKMAVKINIDEGADQNRSDSNKEMSIFYG